jgi:hypothetical protein
VLVHRGDLVSVRVVRDRWVVRRQATAMEDGREGDEIEFAGASDSRDRFRALITGRGQAVVRSGPAGGTGVANTQAPQ